MDSKKVSFRLGDIFGEEIKTLVLELSLPSIEQTGQVQIAMLHFEYDELNENGVEHRIAEMPVVINFAPEGEQPVLANPEVTKSVLLLKSAQARQSAVEQADRGNYAQASEVLRSAAEAISQSGIEHEALSDERIALLKQATAMELGAENYDSHSRKVMSTQAIYTMTDRHNATQAMRVREIERMVKEQQQAAPQQPPSAPPTEKNGAVPTNVVWKDHTFTLTGDMIRIGRAEQNEIIIDAKGISRFHCQIKRENGKLILEDLNSTNGTLIGGHPLREPFTLSVGDEVFVCNEKLVFTGD
jgi:Arc/MetJ-type ribon-helix-helix transcriptional regulator